MTGLSKHTSVSESSELQMCLDLKKNERKANHEFHVKSKNISQPWTCGYFYIIKMQNHNLPDFDERSCRGGHTAAVPRSSLHDLHFVCFSFSPLLLWRARPYGAEGSPMRESFCMCAGYITVCITSCLSSLFLLCQSGRGFCLGLCYPRRLRLLGEVWQYSMQTLGLSVCGMHFHWVGFNPLILLCWDVHLSCFDSDDIRGRLQTHQPQLVGLWADAVLQLFFSGLIPMLCVLVLRMLGNVGLFAYLGT